MAEDNPQVVSKTFTYKTIITSILAGGLAGTSIDFVLFPVDSIKTRLQASSAKVDFTISATDISKFRGLSSAMAAAFPCAATFWLSYEYGKYALRKAFPADSSMSWLMSIHMQHVLASSFAETMQLIVRCPFEVVK
jgi:solute carrier family 25 (mitochondrial S-adenosylmethionine transporter), member 26